MAKFKSTTAAVAIAAGVMALAFSASAANAGTVSFDLGYQTGSILSGSTVAANLMANDLGTFTIGTTNYEEYKVTSILGTTSGTGFSLPLTGLLAPNPTLDIAISPFTEDDIIFKDLATGKFAIDSDGLGFKQGTTFINLYAQTFDPTSIYYGLYVQSTDYPPEDAVVSNLTITQVPAPMALALLGTGLLGLGAVSRRKKSV
jgi:hypothetical protein